MGDEAGEKPLRSKLAVWIAYAPLTLLLLLFLAVVSKRTVVFHADNARVKLGAASPVETVIRAVVAGLIYP